MSQTHRQCVRSRWYSQVNIQDLYSRLKPGDLLEFNRQGYSHWAVYVGISDEIGEHSIIHFAGPANACKRDIKAENSSHPCNKTMGKIQHTSVLYALDIDTVRLNNELDIKFEWIPRNAEEIVAVAKKHLEEPSWQKPYNLFTNNCEHFANMCRYGKIYSRQIKENSKKIGLFFGSVFFSAARIATPISIVFCPPAAVIAVSAVGTATFVIPALVHFVKSHQRNHR